MIDYTEMSKAYFHDFDKMMLIIIMGKERERKVNKSEKKVVKSIGQAKETNR